MDNELCQRALEAAVGQCGGSLPEIFNTDQGSQFTSAEWTGKITALGMAVSMDGKGRWMDNVFIERLTAQRQIRGDLPAGACHGAGAGRGPARVV